MTDNYCNNCGKQGHNYNQCKLPITSFGIITFRHNPNTQKIEYLTIRRKDTLGFIDFMRGKYSINNRKYILNMIKQMTNDEKHRLLTDTFEKLWHDVWGFAHVSNQYKSEETSSKHKFIYLHNNTESFTLADIINESNNYDCWTEPEWGFPKGRRNYLESDIDCSIREFTEETGVNVNNIDIITNIFPFEEIFTGSNYKSYKHKYYLANINYYDENTNSNFEKSEVSKVSWKTFTELNQVFRPYNLEKKSMLLNIHSMLSNNYIMNVL
jgi:ADP-ribose pyrophosphatase YjhB (NUDIX family)